MKVRTAAITLLLCVFCVSLSLGQCPSSTGRCPSQVPHLVKFTGSLKEAAGAASGSLVGITFSIYSAPTGGPPLWQETQNVWLDQQRRYSVFLGAGTLDGVPTNLFSSGEPRWIGARAQLPGEPEESRVPLVSVPYAMEAGDAQTLGGLPASAFVKVSPNQFNLAVPGSSPGLDGSKSLGAALSMRTWPAIDAGVITSGGTVNVIPKFSGPNSIANSQITDSAGVVSMPNLSNILFADRFPKGVPDAVAACPAAGCIIYAIAPRGSRNLGVIDPGGKSITIYLGPYTYTVTQITLRQGLKIIGMGSSPNGTVLQSMNGNNPVIVLPQANFMAATNVVLSGLRLIGAVGNTVEDAFLLDTSSLNASGLWYSMISDIYIMNFGGIGLHIKGPSNFGAVTQWVTFDRVVAMRPQGGGNGIRIEGGAFELLFTNCEVDGYAPGGQAQPGSGTNVYLGGAQGGVNGFPLDVSFQGLVSQGAAVGVQLDGAAGISFDHSHHEILLGGYLITSNSNMGTWGVTISNSTFMGNVGLNTGSGYLLNVATTFARGIRFVHNVFSTADAIVAGANLSEIEYRDNLYLGFATVPPTSGLTRQLSPSTTINIGNAHTVELSQSTTAITTIQSTMGPGETVTLFAPGGAVEFAGGGNIDLLGRASVTVSGSITFVRIDGTGSLSWVPLAQWNP